MKKNKADLAQIDELEIQALTDEELEAVSSAAAEASNSCSCCASGATVQTNPPRQPVQTSPFILADTTRA